MKTTKYFKSNIFALIILIITVVISFGGKPSDQKGKVQGPRKILTNDFYHPMTINSIFNYYSNNGDGSFNPFSVDDEGFEFNKGSGGMIIFEDGVVWGGFHKGILKVGGSTYNHGLQAGRIVTPGDLTHAPIADDPGAAKNRLYRVRPDINPSTNHDEAIAILNLEEVPYISRYENFTAEEIYQQYITDWAQWPANEGAPFDDKNHNGIYEPDSGDVPGVIGADQTMWHVSNDLDVTATQHLYGSDPIGIEEQRTIWGYKRTGALGYTIFISTKFINKSGFPIDSMYISQWSDPDLGGSLGYRDDFVGCDTTRSLGFVYNGLPRDAFFGTKVPAGGYVFFQGPIVPTGSPSDSAIFDLKYRYGYKNLKMSAFNFFINGNATYADPRLQDPRGTSEWYNLMNGLVGRTGSPYINPITHQPDKFLLSGDPVSGSGWLDGQIAPPDDRRMALIAGPFTMANGDTQQVVVANLAGVGSDRITSVAVLKYYSDLAQQAYNSLFNLANPPMQPKVTKTELDGEVVISWADPTRYPITESQDDKGYKFEGYNIYQTIGPSFSNPTRLATYDVKNLVTIIEDYVFDVNLGTVVKEPVQKGGDFGIQRYMDIKTDVFNTFGSGLVNGQTYYFWVSAYNYNPTPGLKGNNLECSPVLIQVTPHKPDLGVRDHASHGDTILAVHNTGIADAYPIIKILDPTKLTADNYEVTISVTDSVYNPTAGVWFPNPKWQLRDVTKNTLILPPSTIYKKSITPSDTIVDGMQVAVSGAPFWVAGSELGSQTYVPAANFNFDGANGGLTFFNGGLDVGNNFIGGALNPWQVFQDIEVIFDTANGQKAYDFHRTTGGGSAGAPYSGFYPQPFRAYDVTDPAHPRQIDFVFMERDGQPTENNIWAPGAAAGNREYFWFVGDDYTATEKPEYAGKTLANLLNTKPVYWGGWYILKDPNKPAYQQGDIWRIKTAKVITASDVWSINTAHKAQTFSSTLQKDDVNQINVFPNPYFGFNKAEINKYNRFVTISHLPKKATIRIYNLAGILVRTIMKENDSQFQQWDLVNESGLPAAAGMYIIYIDMPDIGKTKTLKLAIIPESQILDRL